LAGVPDTPAYEGELRRLAHRLGVEHRVEWLGFLSDEEMVDAYAHSLGVIYPPFDEDYGYVTLEAMLSSKPIVTCRDSGGPLEFVLHERTGLVADCTPSGVAEALDAAVGES
jgi:glycosyltransferase involved in cell wall biosynthesis